MIRLTTSQAVFLSLLLAPALWAQGVAPNQGEEENQALPALPQEGDDSAVEDEEEFPEFPELPPLPGTEPENDGAEDGPAGLDQEKFPDDVPENTERFHVPIEDGATGQLSMDFSQADTEAFEGNIGLHWYLDGFEESGLSIDTFGSNFDSALYLYERDEDGDWALTNSNDDANAGLQSQLFANKGARELLLQVTNLAGTDGDLVLSIAPVEVDELGNDDWEMATVIEQAEFTSRGNNQQLQANPQEAERGSSQGLGLWWSFTAPSDGDVIVDTNNSSFNTILMLGTPNGNEMPLREQRDDDGGNNLNSRIALSMEEGETRYFMLDTLDGGRGDWTFNFRFYEGGRPRAENDSVAKAQDVGLLLPVRLEANNELAEVDERERGLGAIPDGRGLWWQFTPSQSGVLELDGYRSSIDVVLGVYLQEGKREPRLISNSRNRGWNFARELSVPVEGGQNYLILVESMNRGIGDVSVDLKLRVNQVMPLNDHFDHALDLGQPMSLSFHGNLTGSSAEEGESQPIQPAQSLWYRWKAPQAGWVRLRVKSPSENGRHAMVQIFQGESLGSLNSLWDAQTRQTLVEIIDDAPWIQDGALIPVAAGDELKIQVVGADYRDAERLFRFELEMIETETMIPSDSIEQAEQITSLPYRTRAWTQLASREAWEQAQWPDIEQTLWWSYTAPKDQIVEVSIGDRHGMVSQLAVARRTDQGEPEIFFRSETRQTLGNSTWFGELAKDETIWFAIGSTGRVAGLQNLSLREIEASEIPSNAQLAKALDLGAVGETRVGYNLRFASGEEGEEGLSPGQSVEGIRSLWYTWTAPRDGVLDVNANGMSGARVSIFALDPDQVAEADGISGVGQLRELAEELASVELRGAGAAMANQQPQLVRVDVREGQKLYLRLDQSPDGLRMGLSSGIDIGQLLRGAVELELLEAPEGDRLANALSIEKDLPQHLEVDLLAATLEDWERDAGLKGEASLWLQGKFEEEGWLRLIPSSELALEAFEPASGPGAHPRARESVPTIETDPILLRVGPENPLLLRLRPRNGTQRGAVSAARQDYSLELSVAEARERPENDDFDQAKKIAELPFSEVLDVALAQREEFENQGSLSVWYRFEAPIDGLYRLRTAGSEFDTVLEVYQGEVLEDEVERRSNLIQMNDDSSEDVSSQIDLKATAGTSYLVRARAYATPARDRLKAQGNEDIQFDGDPLMLHFSIEGPESTDSEDEAKAQDP